MVDFPVTGSLVSICSLKFIEPHDDNDKYTYQRTVWMKSRKIEKRAVA